MIRVENISHSYQGKPAVTDISFNVEKGEMFGLVGPDGAGKSTLFRILTTLILPDKGNAYVNSVSIRGDYTQIRKSVGYMPGRFSLYQDLSVKENLKLFATMFGTTIEENYKLIRDIYVQIEPFKNRKAGKLSGGMKQKLALCCALIHKPDVLFLDEPTTGVDPVSRKEFWQMLDRLRKQGITIMVSTPYMDEAVLCDRIGFIKEGRLFNVDRPEQILKSFPYDIISVKSGKMHGIKDIVKDIEGVDDVYSFGEYFHLRTVPGAQQMALQIYEALSKNGYGEIVIKPVKPTIEDCFIYAVDRV